jgi:hypothetical protein
MDTKDEFTQYEIQKQYYDDMEEIMDTNKAIDVVVEFEMTLAEMQYNLLVAKENIDACLDILDKRKDM